MSLDDFSRWAWGLMIVPIIALFTGKADKSEVEGLQTSINLKADKTDCEEAHNEVDQMRRESVQMRGELAHITERVDKIYDHLITKGK